MGIDSLLPLCRLQEINLGLQAGQQVPFPLSHLPWRLRQPHVPLMLPLSCL